MKLQLALGAAMFAAGAGAIAQTTVTFQNGLNGYGGAFDRRLHLSNSVNGADVDTTVSPLWIDGDPIDPSRSDYLIRFDDILGVTGIPAGATILDAKLSLTTTAEAVNMDSRSGESYNLYRLTQPFDGASTLDGDFGDGSGGFTDNVDGVEPEQGEADWILSTFDHPVGDEGLEPDETYSASVTRAVQSWVNGSPNYGIAVVSDHRDNDDGWSVHSTGSPEASLRPSLTVTYTTDPNYRVHELQQGLNGYTGTTDVLLNVLTDWASTPERDDDTVVGGVDASTESEVFLDGDNSTDGGDTGNSYDTPYLIHFDLAGVEGEVRKAELLIATGFTSASSDSPGPFTVHQMRTPFDAGSVYGDFAGDVNALLAVDQIGPAVGTLIEIDEAEYVSLDISSVVSNWLAGEPNYGLYIGANGTSNGWQIFTSGAVDPDLAPMLRITTVPEPTALVLVALGGLFVARRR